MSDKINQMMFLPYRVIQIKSKNKAKIVQTQQPTLKFCDPLPLSLDESIRIDPSQQLGSSIQPNKDNKKAHAHKDSPMRPNTQFFAKFHKQNTLTRAARKQKDGGNKIHFSKRYGISDSGTNNIRQEKSKRHRESANEVVSKRKYSETVQKYECFNFSLNLEQAAKDKNIKNRDIIKVRNLHQKQQKDNTQNYGHRSLDISSKMYQTLPLSSRPNPDRPFSSREKNKNQPKVKVKILKGQKDSFGAYIEQIRKAKAYNENKSRKQLEENPDPFVIEPKLFTVNKQERLSKQKLTILEQIYDKWKNSHKLHVKGKTIRRWAKKQSGNASMGDCNDKKQIKAKKMGASHPLMKDDDNKIEAWNETVLQERQSQFFLDYDPEFTMGKEKGQTQ